ncbi:MAG TPA: Na+/H+ antiporter subunit E [Devosia sp.]|jgi:multicomponent Na+:H+ antiporter subunit E|nr:Na+/H+ antiporter subunit E [Devosia sp.]
MNLLRLIALFVRELILSALRVAWLVLQPKLTLRPGIIAYPLSVTSDRQIALLANMITLTPGTLSIDVSDDRRTLFIHAIDVTDRETLIGQIAAGFETLILRAIK